MAMANLKTLPDQRWTKSETETLEDFIQRLVPSRLSKQDTKHIRIVCPLYDTEPDASQLNRLVVSTWEHLHRSFWPAVRSHQTAGPASSKELTPGQLRQQQLIDLATAQGIRGGAWLVPIPFYARDAVWKHVAAKTYEGSMGTAASLHIHPDRTDSGIHWLCIHHSDSGDRERIEALALQIWDMARLWKEGHVNAIYYKHNVFIFTEMNCYFRWNALWSSSWPANDVKHLLQ